MNLSPLRPLSAAWGAAARAKAALYRRGWLRQERAPAPVLSVGNLSAGGTGKTPLAILVARILHEDGLCPAVVSRGYRGRRRQDPLVVSAGSGLVAGVGASEAGDEPVMIARALPEIPVVVARRRSQGSRVAVERLGANVLILDDGFQHLALYRDLDLVLIEAERPLQEGQVLPAGTLREDPVALGRADALLLSWRSPAGSGPREELAAGVREWISPTTPIFHTEFHSEAVVDLDGQERRPIEWLNGRKVLAFAGIARPERLRDSLLAAGAEILRFLPFPDHHAYTAREIAGLAAACDESGGVPIVTTEKDLARLAGSAAAGSFGRHRPVALAGGTVLVGGGEDPFRELIVTVARGGAR